jgi:hypothetical protein
MDVKGDDVGVILRRVQELIDLQCGKIVPPRVGEMGTFDEDVFR